MFPLITRTYFGFPPFFSHAFAKTAAKNGPPNIRCESKPAGDRDPTRKQTPELKFDRRGFLLLGFGSSGIYNTVSTEKPLSPDFVNCGDAVRPDGRPIDCCPDPGSPPSSSDVSDFVPPTAAAPTRRVRSAAQTAAGAAALAKYTKAVELMKKLPADDPRSFRQQADVHCAYCDGAYAQRGFPDLRFEIHESWLFFPFHRWYLYFFERICARLLDDDAFALPFWNWDGPSGMEIPAPFAIPGSPLHDRRRDRSHLPPAVADLNWDGSPTGLSPEKQRYYNLSVMYKQMVNNGVTPRLFMGQPFKAGDDISLINGAGSIETAPHNTVHVWTGDPREPNGENMGVFYSAARDPIFYTHHANIDRLWTIWADKLGGKVFTDPDWLETSFVFYNEDKKPVRVKTKDCLDLSRLGYAYQEIETPWLNAKPKPRLHDIRVRSPDDVITDDRDFPRELNESLNILVKRRPSRKMSSIEKEKINNENEEEVLVIEIVEYDIGRHVKFDVYLNEDDVESCMPDNTEFLGSFVSVPRGGHDDDDVIVASMRGAQSFGLSNVVAELGVEEDEVLMVTLVPRRGCAGLAVGGVRIEFDASGSGP